jgi:hypothetical protein
MNTDAGPTFLAVTSEDERHQAVVRQALERAREHGASLILYDLDAPVGPLAEPLPTNWSGEGQEQMVGNRLGPEDLEAAGRERLARQVRDVREAGVMAYGWLPDDDDPETLVDYAKAEQVARVFVGSGDELAADLGLDIEEVDTARARDRR